MKIESRQQLLSVWRSLVETSFVDGQWQWAGRDRPDSVINAQQLLCLMTPVMEMESLRFARPDETYDDVLKALQGMGDAVSLPRTMVDVLIEYYERHQLDGEPLFNGGTHFTRYQGEQPDQAVLELDIVEGFALSVTLSLSVMSFARSFQTALTRDDLIKRTERLYRMASRRLTAAMIGLLRSFTVYTFNHDSVEGEILLATANQANQPTSRALQRLRDDLRDVTAGLRDLRLGSGDASELEAPTRLYEIGWTWGIIKGAPTVDVVEDFEHQREGVAIDAPYLYFTVVVLDAISDLFSERTRLLGLLDAQQHRLAQALQIRWELTQRYWSVMSTHSQQTWPIEDLPWRTTDGEEDDYFSLLVSAISVREMVLRNVPDRDLRRLGEVLRELSNRGRITRRPVAGDPAVRLHTQGRDTGLSGVEALGSSEVGWKMLDFAPLVFKRAVDITRSLSDNQLRAEMSEVTDLIWSHVLRRQIGEGPARWLWDRPSAVFGTAAQDRGDPTWQVTLRVVEGLVYASYLASSEPLRSDRLIQVANELLAEAKQLYDQEQLRGGGRMAPSIQDLLKEVDARLRRAEDIIERRPGSATAILLDSLRDLDRLDAARADRGWVG